jgi:hypothetical protein
MLTFLARALLAELLLVEAFLASYVVAQRLLRRDPTALRWVGVVTCAAMLATIEFHLLRALNAFHLLGATLSQTLVTVAALRLCLRRGELQRWVARDLHFARKLGRRCRRSPYRGAVLAFGVLSLPILIRPLILPPLGWDSLTYHAVKAGMWVQHAGALPMDGPGTWAYYALLWGGGEIFTAWAMLPFHSDLLATQVDAVEWLALGIALIALARELGLREPAASAAAGFALAIPTLRISVGSGYVEVALVLMAACAWALGSRFLQRASLGAFYLALGAASVATGIKFTFLPLSILTLAALGVAMILQRSSLRSRLLHLAAGATLFSLILLPWPWAAYRQSGLPLSPLPVELLGRPLGRPPPELAWYMDRPDTKREPSEFSLLTRALLQERMGPGATTMFAVAISVFSWPLLLRRRARAVLFVVLVIAAAWIGFFASGLSVVRHHFSTSAVRFLLVALVPGVLLSAGLCRARSRLGRAYLLYLIAGTFFQLLLYLPYGLSASGARALSILLFALGLIAAIVWSLARRPDPLGRFVAPAALVAFALLGLNGFRDQLRFDLYRNEFVIHPVHRYWLDAARLVDSRKTRHRIAVTSGPFQDLDNWLVYPFLGRELQNDVLHVPISRDGAVRHFGAGDSNLDYARSADFASWRERLREREVTEVLSFRPASIELSWMEGSPGQFRRLAGDAGDWGLFAVESPSSSDARLD